MVPVTVAQSSLSDTGEEIQRVLDQMQNITHSSDDLYTSQESEYEGQESGEVEAIYYRDDYVLYPNDGYNGRVGVVDDSDSSGGYESGDEWSLSSSSQGEPESVVLYNEEESLSRERVGVPNRAGMGGGTVAAASGSHDLTDDINNPNDQDGGDTEDAKKEEEDVSEGELEVAREDGNVTAAVASVLKQYDLK